MSAPAPPPPPPVLLVDDDLELGTMVVELLRRDGIACRQAATVADGLDAVQRHAPALVLLDVMLPDGNGIDLCRRLRALDARLPIVMLTARGDPFDRVLGLEVGADDYLPKPFEPRELVARVRAQLRRQAAFEQRHRLRSGDLVVDQVARQATLRGRSLPLTSTEFKLLAALMAQAGRSIGRDALSAAVQPGQYLPLTRTVDVQVARLRRKLADADPDGRWIETVRGEGYVFVGPMA